MDCKHENFVVNGKVGRLYAAQNPDEITEYRLDVEVHCADCFKPFQFVGLPGGYHPSYPTTDVEQVEARMPIRPV